jgi:hypothetical protein
MGSPSTLFSMIQAREVAQAELAIARQKVEQELAAAKAKEDAAIPPTGNGGEPSQEGPGMASAVADGPNPAREVPLRKKRLPKVVPVGHRPVTRQARAQNRVV